MNLNQEILNQCSDFFKRIPNKAGNKRLDDAIEELLQVIQDDVDDFSSLSDEEIARDTQEALEAIWDLIDEEEKRANPMLEATYDAIGGNLEDYSGYNRKVDGRFQDFLKRLDDEEYHKAREEEFDDEEYYEGDEELDFDEYDEEECEEDYE